MFLKNPTDRKVLDGFWRSYKEERNNWKTMGLKLPSGLRVRLDRIKNKYGLSSRTHAVYYALLVGCTLLEDEDRTE
jgi:hypothetical protein